MSAIILTITGAGLSFWVMRSNRKKAIMMEHLGPDHVVRSCVYTSDLIRFQFSALTLRIYQPAVPVWTYGRY